MLNAYMRLPSHSPAAPVDAPPAPGASAGDAPYLTMDSLLVYCESRIRGLDSQVNAVFADQQRANDASSAIGWLESCCAQCEANGIDDKGTAVHDLIRAFQLAIGKVGADSPTGQKLLEKQQAFIRSVGKNGGADLMAEMQQPGYWTGPVKADAGMLAHNLSGDQVKAMVDGLKEVQADVNHGSELGMITLQSLMSQRQMAIQLVTNLVQSLGEMTNKIAANVGH
jgi:hypothetical protein